MLPSAFVALAAFPLTPNGKLDRAALPAPDAAAVLTRTFAAPQGPIESAIATLWSDLLGLDRVGRHDHFFELGGHSLLVVTLIERLRQHGLVADVRAIFAAPVLADLAAAIGSAAPTQRIDVPPNRITPECAAITPDLLPLVSLTQAEIDGLIAAVPGGVTNIQDIYPLAPLQEGILFHHLLQHEGDAYLLRSVSAFASRELLDRCLAALQVVIDRHDVLRTAIHWQGVSTPVQVVQRRATLPIDELPAGDDALARVLAHTDPRRTRLDLTRAPLLAATITFDATSGEWLHGLVAASRHDRPCHSRSGDGRGPRNPTRQQRRACAINSVSHFCGQIAIDAGRRTRGVLVTLPVRNSETSAPFGYLDVRGDGDRIDELRLRLSRELSTRTRHIARAQGVSAAVLFHVAWALVVARCCGRDDVVFGTTLSGRLQGSAGADRALGMLINTLPVRVTFDAHNVRDIVANVYRQLGELVAHEQAPLALAQRCSGLAASQPLFTTLLNYHHSVLPSSIDAGASTTIWHGIRMLRVEERTNYPITVSVDDLGEEFALIVQCVEGISAARVGGYLLTAIESVVDALMHAPERQATALAVLPAAERAQVTPAAVSGFETHPIHVPFEEQAAVQPDAVAVVFDDRSLTYAELNRRANRLAHRLIALGVQPDTRVAICLERGLDLIVGLLGILKAGGAYVPLDPGYPTERLAYMLDDSAPVAVVTQQSLCDRLPGGERPTLVLDDAATMAALAECSSDNPGWRALGLTPRIWRT